MLKELAADGHDIEAHGINHLNGIDYEAMHSAHDYVVDEIVPSIAALRADGYAVSSFAVPYSASDAALHTEALTVIDRVRTGGGGCP
jgi:hypothetical protein